MDFEKVVFTKCTHKRSTLISSAFPIVKTGLEELFGNAVSERAKPTRKDVYIQWRLPHSTLSLFVSL